MKNQDSGSQQPSEPPASNGSTIRRDRLLIGGGLVIAVTIIGIIGIFSGIICPGCPPRSYKAQVDVRIMASAISMYAAHYGTIPSDHDRRNTHLDASTAP